jgi:hypothetical protein
MFFNMNQPKNGTRDSADPMGGMGPMGGMSGLPGPAMMMSMMPMMMGRMLSSESPETRKERILEVVTSLVGQSTSDLSEDEYTGFVDELVENLRNREEVRQQTPSDCC